MSQAHRNVPSNSARPSLAPRRSPVPRSLRCAPRRLRERRGVLLLVVLSVLVLFVLLTVTYVIVASKERVTSKAAARVEISGDPPSQVCDSLMMMMLRDTVDRHSPFHTWSLLEGIYGNASFHGSLDKASGIMDGGGTGPRAKNTGGQFYYIALTSTPTGYRSNANYYAGCVLTMLTGPCAGVSTRVVGSDGSGLVVMRFRADAGLTDPSIGDAFVVNGPAYSGMGRGYDPTYKPGQLPPATQAPNGYAYVSDPNDPNASKNPQKTWEFALLPNPAYFQTQPASGSYPAYDDPAGWGGANVDYTAYDYNNMYLGLLTNDTTGNLPPVLPSFHRFELYRYWANRIKPISPTPTDPPDKGLTDVPNLLRKILFRPNSYDHPIFCKTTNPAFNQAYPVGAPPATQTPGPAYPLTPLDVDNMGTGVPDSIWIDPGLPVMTARDGRTYKVMVAPLILDLDGRVNLNAHGSDIQADQRFNYRNSSNGQFPIASKSIAGGVKAQLPVGEGFGPADINLWQLFQGLPPNVSADLIQNILFGGGSMASNPGRYQGRHGQWPSSTSSRALLSLKQFEGPPQDYSNYTTPTAYGTPSDQRGRRFVAVDYSGQPLYMTQPVGPIDPSDWSQASKNPWWQEEVFGFNSGVDSPYGFNLFIPTPGRAMPPGTVDSHLDNPFTVAELERIMRPYDIDNRALAPRLQSLLNSGLTSNPSGPSLAGKITTDSWDVPVPALAAPHDFRKLLNNYWQQVGQVNLSNSPALAGRGFQVADLLRAKLYDVWVKDTTVQPPMNKQQAQLIQQKLDAEVGLLLSPDVMAGLRMNINRPFGNGRDDVGNHVVDDVLDRQPETILKTRVGAWPNVSNFPISIQLSPADGDGSATNDPLLKNTVIPAAWKPRQLMARYLYTLMMLFTDQGYISWIEPAEDNATPPLSATQKQELTARRVAQWAINAVCFRDSTSAMTPFEYQADIFQSGYKGWKVDGDPGTDETQQGNVGRHLVWGCKPPDLVLTETLAFHDRRTADTTTDDDHKTRTDDTDPMKKDPNFDQIRVPQGSLFVELYCTRNRNNPVAPGDLYTYKDGQWYLDLTKMASDGKNNPVPVWRMVITETPREGNTNAKVSDQMAQHPETFSPHSDPNGLTMHLNSVDSSIAAKIDRTIWLGQTPPPAAQRPGVFYNRNQQIFSSGRVLVAPGGYAAIGPRVKTSIGSSGVKPYGKQSAQTISMTMNPTPDIMETGTSNNKTAGTSKSCVPMIVAADPPDGTNGTTAWTDASHKSAKFSGIGLNVSEPLPTDKYYYPEPTIANPAAVDPNYRVEAYGDLAGNAAKPFRDPPLEGTKGDKVDPNAQFRPLVKDGVLQTDNYPGYKYIFLQRLADPLLPFDAQRNPYITVDWMPIDLTTFNGEQPWDQGAPDPDDAKGGAPKLQFASRQRGGSDPSPNPPPPAGAYPNLWAPMQTATDTLPFATSGGADNFKFKLNHSLGFLNQRFGPPSTQSLGDPMKPFPWITWNARPYSNLMELLLVPASSPERLLLEFSSPGTTPPTGAVNPYDPLAQPNSRYPFRHLLNFFSADQTYTPGKAANYYRVLEYLRVPSKFVGTETLLNPNAFTATNQKLWPFLPPFNTVSNYRDPGLVNINTITAQEVWNAVMNNVGTPGYFGPTYQQLVDSRRWDQGTTGQLLTANTALPTSFAGAYRSSAAADLVPLNVMMRSGVEATLLRPNKPLGVQGDTPLFSAKSTADYNNTDSNPFFRYQPVDRISNMVTTRSNVFAVWLTVGYFEVLPWPQKGVNYVSNPNTELNAADFAAHADGYQLGAELGSDTGEIVRHRAFYIIDRSIPVGYERGQNNNVNRAILLRRFIE